MLSAHDTAKQFKNITSEQPKQMARNFHAKRHATRVTTERKLSRKEARIAYSRVITQFRKTRE